MSYRHEILYLNSSRAYVRVGDTWYDTRNDFDQQVGDQFLIGAIEEIMTHKEYTKQYPESKTEIGPKASEKTMSGGYIRKASSLIDANSKHISVVEYAINPQQFQIEKTSIHVDA